MRTIVSLALISFAPAAPAADAPARLRVRLPADAVLIIDGQTTQTVSDVRYFVTPPLPAGTDYAYELRAEMIRRGRKLTVVRRVTVRAGGETTADFDPPAEGVAPAPRPRPVWSADDGSVGGARDGWKPDPTDPFYPWQ